jgi:ABC-type Fe3+-hydroxamate transport system substrate-binding protein
MHLLFLFFTLVLFSACTTTPEVSTTVEKESHSKILANQTDAQQAKDEYKLLQAQRDKE